MSGQPGAAHEALLRWNRASRGLDPPGAALVWFAALPEPAQTVAIENLAMAVQQARPSAADLPEAVRLSGLLPTHTPWVMLERSTADRTIFDVSRLAGLQRAHAARALLALLAVADGRRRAADAECVAGRCRHWWHGPLPEIDPR